MKNSLLFGLLTYIIILTLPMGALAQQTAEVVELLVDGMVSPTCPVLLKSAVRKITGVKQVEASLDDKTATIEYDKNLTSLEEIQQTIQQQAGFTTELQ